MRNPLSVVALMSMKETRNTGDPEYPCKGRTIRVCGRIKYKKSNSYTVNGMTTYTCDKEVFDADGHNIYLGNGTVTVPEGWILQRRCISMLLRSMACNMLKRLRILMEAVTSIFVIDYKFIDK